MKTYLSKKGVGSKIASKREEWKKMIWHGPQLMGYEQKNDEMTSWCL